MRLIFFVGFLVEVLAFIGVAQLIGLGWAFLAVFALMFLGGLAANVALRNSLRRAAQGQSSFSRLAGDSAILITGWVLTVIPGFVSSIVGLLLVFGPTRSLVRRLLTARAERAMEDFGVRAYTVSPMSRYTTSYGTFTDPEQRTSQPDPEREHEVIDADELEEIFRMESAEPGFDPTRNRRRGTDDNGDRDDETGSGK